MPVTIGSNIASLSAQRQLDRATFARGQATERLSSGQRINRASDDAAGLSIATSLQARSRVYSQALRNVNDGVSLLTIADGALSQLSDIVTRQRELAEQSANGTYGNRQRQALDNEAFALTKEYNRIIQSTSFNGQYILDGSDDAVRLQHGYGAETSTLVRIGSEIGVAAGDGTFQGALTLATGSGPTFLTATDVNEDGIVDLVSVDQGPSRLSVFVGNGDGTFQAVRTLATGSVPNSVAATDVNGDGIIDLVSTDTSSNRLSVFVGNGDGTFQDVKTVSTGNAPRYVAGTDVNGDGIIDLVSADGSSNRLSVFIGNGDGTFQTAATLATGFNPNSVAATDVNGDGVIDIVSAELGSNQLSVFMGNGDGTFQTAATLATGFSPNSVAATDVNGDGVIDIVSAEGASNRLSVFLGNGNGTFQAARTLATGSTPFSIKATDVNGDGVIDLAWADFNSARLSVVLGNGDGTFQAVRTLPTGNQPRSVMATDVNGDGVIDIVSADQSSNQLSVFVGNPDPTGRRNNLQTAYDLSSIQGARSTLDSTSVLLDRINRERGNIGAAQSRLQAVASTLRVAGENFDAARSRIVDADVAQESAELVRTGIVQQAAAAVLAQANQQPSLALQLLSA